MTTFLNLQPMVFSAEAAIRRTRIVQPIANRLEEPCVNTHKALDVYEARKKTTTLNQTTRYSLEAVLLLMSCMHLDSQLAVGI